MQLVDDALHADAALAYTCADRIHLRIGGEYRNFRAEACLARNGFHLHHAALDLRHLELEQALHKARMRAGNKHLRPLIGLSHFQHIDLDAVVVVVFLAGYRFVHGDEAVRFAELNENTALFHALHNGGQDLILLFHVFIEDHAALRLADALHHDLLRRLRRNAAKAAGVRLFFQHVADFIERVDRAGLLQRDLGMRIFHLFHHRLGREDLHLARVPVHHGAHIARGAIIALICRDQRGFESIDQDILADAALFFNCVECLHEFGVH